MVNTQQLIQAADRCVLCGLCSSLCPTYQLHRQEGESPRGRVMMSIALMKGAAKPDRSFEAHLNHCLLCRACENSCPSEVPYGEIIDHARTLLPRPRGKARLLEWAAEQPRLLQLAATTTSLLYRFRFPLPALGNAAAQLLPAAPKKLQTHYPSKRERIGHVGLFLGCVAGPFDQQTHQAAVTLLTHLGYEVTIPETQQCCGALSLHQGDPESAARLAHANRLAFGEKPLDAILFSSSGCGVQLIEQSALPAPCIEICQFLLQSPNWGQLQFQPLALTVLLHHPCSLSNVLQGTTSVEQLIRKIPDITIVPLSADQSCCGAAGSHRLREPETASKLRQPKVDTAIESGITTLLTTNYGCALHLKEGLLVEKEEKITVLHPVILLARALDPSLDEPAHNR